MAGVSVKMGVEGVASFKQGMKDAESAVKTLDAALKLNEQQFKSNGDEALYLQNKTALLQQQIEKQTEVVKQAEAALESMKKRGVDESSKSFQDMQGKVYTAWTKLDEMKQTLNGVKEGAGGAAENLGKTDSALSNIEKNTAWANVSSGLKDITRELESAGRAAINFGKKMFRSVKDSAAWADDLKTTAQQWDIGVEDLQKMQNLAAIIDTDVDAILTARQRMMKATTTKGGVASIEEVLGLDLGDYENPDDLMWDIGDALLHMDNAFDKEGAAMTIFGRSWRELLPMFKTGRDTYEEMLGEQSFMKEEDVNKLGEVDDKLQSINQKLELMKNQFIADNADKILGLLQFFIDNYKVIVIGISAIGIAMQGLKLEEAAVNIGKIVDGWKQLSGNGGTPIQPSIPTGNGTPTTTPTGLSNGGKGWDVLMKGTAAMLLYPTLEKLFTEGVPPAYGTAGDNALDLIGGDGTADLLKKVQNPGGYTVRDVVLGGEPSQVQKNLDAIADWQFGDDMTAEEAMALVSASEGTKEATERMATLAEETNENSKNNLKSQDVQGFKNLPGAVEQAVLNGMSGATVVIDRGAIDTIGGLVGQNLWTQLMGQLH